MNHLEMNCQGDNNASKTKPKLGRNVDRTRTETRVETRTETRTEARTETRYMEGGQNLGERQDDVNKDAEGRFQGSCHRQKMLRARFLGSTVVSPTWQSVVIRPSHKRHKRRVIASNQHKHPAIYKDILRRIHGHAYLPTSRATMPPRKLARDPRTAPRRGLHA